MLILFVCNLHHILPALLVWPINTSSPTATFQAVRYHAGPAESQALQLFSLPWCFGTRSASDLWWIQACSAKVNSAAGSLASCYRVSPWRNITSLCLALVTTQPARKNNYQVSFSGIQLHGRNCLPPLQSFSSFLHTPIMFPSGMWHRVSNHKLNSGRLFYFPSLALSICFWQGETLLRVTAVKSTHHLRNGER